MPIATVRLTDRIADNVIDCAVRANLQGFGSIELCVDDLRIFFPHNVGAPTWRTLAQVLGHPDVRVVTFHGPWTDEPAAQEWRLLGTTDEGANFR